MCVRSSVWFGTHSGKDFWKDGRHRYSNFHCIIYLIQKKKPCKKNIFLRSRNWLFFCHLRKKWNSIAKYEQEILFTLLDGVVSWCLPELVIVCPTKRGGQTKTISGRHQLTMPSNKVNKIFCSYSAQLLHGNIPHQGSF